MLMPIRAAEHFWWLFVSVLAGINEEISWRCVQVALLTQLLGSYWVAAVASALSFASAHAVQGWRSAIIIAEFAIVFQVLVWLSGWLYVAMAVHIAYDFSAGFGYAWFAKKTQTLCRGHLEKSADFFTAEKPITEMRPPPSRLLIGQAYRIKIWPDPVPH
jgi:membrane protease YdiL (CAAX protease family)